MLHGIYAGATDQDSIAFGGGAPDHLKKLKNTKILSMKSTKIYLRAFSLASSRFRTYSSVRRPRASGAPWRFVISLFEPLLT